MTGTGEMTRLDKAIADVSYVYDCLIAYRQLISMPDCNTCKVSDCEYQPEAGRYNRINCPHHKG